MRVRTAPILLAAALVSSCVPNAGSERLWASTQTRQPSHKAQAGHLLDSACRKEPAWRNGLMGAIHATLNRGAYAFFFNQRGLMAGLGLQGSKITRIHPDP